MGDTALAPNGGADPSLLREINAGTTLQAIRERGLVTRSELRTLTRFARTTLDESIKELITRGLVEAIEPAKERQSYGRPAARFRFREEAGHVAGLGFDGVRLITHIADLSGTVVATNSEEIEFDAVPDDPVPMIRSAITSALKTADLNRGTLRAASLALPGVVSPDGVIVRSGAIPHWQGLEAGRLVRRALRVPVFVENHARLAALGEHWQGASQGTTDSVFVLTGLRLGVGIIMDGKVMRGRQGGAGEFGYIPELNWGKPRTHLAAMQALSTNPHLGLAAEEIFTAAADGDRASERFVDSYVADLARGIGAIQNALDPEVIVIGGHLAGVADQILDPLRQRLDGNTLFPARLAKTQLGESAIPLGAIRRTLDYLDTILLQHQW